MLIAYSPPTPIVWVLADSGSVFISDNTALSDGIPARETELGCFDTGSPVVTSITDYLALRGNFDIATPVRVVAVLGLRTVPEGAKLELRGEIAGAPGAYVTLGGNALTQTVYAFEDGTFGAVFVVDADNDPLSGIELRIYNDVDGVVWTEDATSIRIGEIFVAAAAEYQIRPNLSHRLDDSSKITDTIGLQAAVVERASRRVYAGLQVIPQTTSTAFGEDETGLARLRQALSKGSPAMLIPLLRAPAQGPDTVIDYTLVQRTAIFGRASQLGSIDYLGGSRGYWTFSMDFTEIPAG